MLPNAGQVSKSQINHLHFFVLDRLNDILGRGTIESHDVPPALRAFLNHFGSVGQSFQAAQRNVSLAWIRARAATSISERHTDVTTLILRSKSCRPSAATFRAAHASALGPLLRASRFQPVRFGLALQG